MHARKQWENWIVFHIYDEQIQTYKQKFNFHLRMYTKSHIIELYWEFKEHSIMELYRWGNYIILIIILI